MELEELEVERATRCSVLPVCVSEAVSDPWTLKDDIKNLLFTSWCVDAIFLKMY